MALHQSQPVVGQSGAPQLATNAAEAIRDLVHLTRFHDAFVDPAELSRALAELAAMAGHLPQLLDQIHRWLDQEHSTAPLRADTDADADELVCLATGRLTHAAHSAHHLSAALDTSHQYVAQLTTGPTHQTGTRPNNPTTGVNFRP